MIRKNLFKTLTKLTACTLIALTVFNSIPTINLFSPVNTYAQEISFSDGTVNTDELTVVTNGVMTTGNCNTNWTVYDNGLLVITGTYDNSDLSAPDWYNYSDSITKVYCDITGANLTSLFSSLNNVTEITFGENFIANIGSGNVTSMYHMFKNCSSLTSIDVSNWDTSNVTSMRYMFDNCSSLTSIDVSNWNTSNVTDMSGMFRGCNNLKLIKTPYNISNTCSTSRTLPSYTWYLVESGIATDTVITNNNLKGLDHSITITTDKDYIEPPQEYTSDGTHSMLVKANIQSTYSVQIPAIVNLSRTGGFEYAGEYEVGCKGLISNDKAVKVKPDSESIVFTGANTNTIVNGSVVQPKFYFVNEDTDYDNEILISLNEYATTTGTIKADFDTVDNYSGNVGFTFGLVNRSINDGTN